MATSDHFQERNHMRPALPDANVSDTQWIVCAQITTEASGVIQGDCQQAGYEKWVVVINYESHLFRQFDATGELIGTPYCDHFRLTSLWQSSTMVPMEQSMFTGEKITKCQIDALYPGPGGKVSPALQIFLEDCYVLDIYKLYSNQAGPLIVTDLRPTRFRVVDCRKKQEFAYDLKKLQKMG